MRPTIPNALQASGIKQTDTNAIVRNIANQVNYCLLVQAKNFMNLHQITKNCKCFFALSSTLVRAKEMV